MSPHQRFSLSAALIMLVAMLVAFSSPASAQGRFPCPAPYPCAEPPGAIRIEATPRRAEVYVNGYYAGIVDDFDGRFQRLRVMPGEHEIALYLAGYRTVVQTVHVNPGSTVRIRNRMEPLVAAETAGPRPAPGIMAPGPPPEPLPPAPRARGDRGDATGQLPAQPEAGAIAIRVQPADAQVLIDGQPWAPSPGGDLLVDASEGRHVVQIHKAGYVGYLTEVDVRRGQTTTLNVTLRTQP